MSQLLPGIQLIVKINNSTSVSTAEFHFLWSADIPEGTGLSYGGKIDQKVEFFQPYLGGLNYRIFTDLSEKHMQKPNLPK